MKPKPIHFIGVYLSAVLAYLAFTQGGWYTWLLPLTAFGIIPVLEVIVPPAPKAVAKDESAALQANPWFNVPLYMAVPVQWGMLLLFLFSVGHAHWQTWELAGMVVSMGIMCGVFGINMAHELGHRSTSHEQWMAQALLLTSQYMHFFIEHNRGHHKRAATLDDPASARYNENVYSFILRAVSGTYANSWKLENERLQREGKPTISFENQMLRFQLLQFALLVGIGLIFGLKVLLLYLGAAVTGFVLLEIIDYVEHYGLQRQQLEPGIYERFGHAHAWNCNRVLGRYLLFELTLHTHHHYNSSVKYQALHSDLKSPQMPAGYPAMMLLTLLPPLWFHIMNRRIAEYSPG